MDKDLMNYFIDQTNSRFDKFEAKIDELNKFRFSIIAQSRLTSLVVSAACGLLTMLGTLWLAYKTH